MGIGTRAQALFDGLVTSKMASTRPYAAIKGFFGGPGFTAARTRAKAISMDVLAGARGKSWGHFAVGAGASGAVGAGAGYASDSRDRMGGAMRGAGLGVLGFGAYRGVRGAWSSSQVRGGLNELGTAMDNFGARTKGTAQIRQNMRTRRPLMLTATAGMNPANAIDRI